MTSKKILPFFFVLNLIIIFYGYISGFSKSLWLDELLSIIFGRELSELNFVEKFTQISCPFFLPSS